IPSGVRHFTARQLGIRDITVLAEYGCYRFLQRWLHRLPAGQGSPLPEYCASSLFITLINIFYMNTCHCRQ
ncbi:TPA: hypothetical protein ACMENM_002552, partial [Klebsiella variicola subsp. variicola]